MSALLVAPPVPGNCLRLGKRAEMQLLVSKNVALREPEGSSSHVQEPVSAGQWYEVKRVQDGRREWWLTPDSATTTDAMNLLAADRSDGAAQELQVLLLLLLVVVLLMLLLLLVAIDADCAH